MSKMGCTIKNSMAESMILEFLTIPCADRACDNKVGSPENEPAWLQYTEAGLYCKDHGDWELGFICVNHEH